MNQIPDDFSLPDCFDNYSDSELEEVNHNYPAPAKDYSALLCHIAAETEKAILVVCESPNSNLIIQEWIPLSQITYIRRHPHSSPAELRDIIHATNWILNKKGLV